MILILEDNEDRIRAFGSAVMQLGETLRLKIWRDALAMMVECDEFLADAALISLDHDLNPERPNTPDVGTGLDVASFLSRFPPICPVILHSSNTDRVWSMHNEFCFANWHVERVSPIGADWIPRSWLRMARSLLEEFNRNPTSYEQPVRTADHRGRFDRALLSLHGLAIGDGIGEMMFTRPQQARRLILGNKLPAGPWFHTDDTEMGIAILEVLRILGRIDQDSLARHFAWRFELDPDRGYGSGTRRQLRDLLENAHWQQTSREAFGGRGSMGNGSAMRVAPVGAWFADDLNRVSKEAETSAIVTHLHPEGIAGAIAIAIAAGMAWRLRSENPEKASIELLDTVLQHTPAGRTQSGIAQAGKLLNEDSPEKVAKILGNGTQVTCPDTVPFTLWCAAKYLKDFSAAIANTASCGGDCDTNCAIVGGIVALSTGRNGIPEDWLEAKERLPFVMKSD